MENMVMYPPPRISGLSLYITLFLRVFKILSIISMHSFTKYELHEEVTHINENIAAGFPPLEMFTCWSEQTPQCDPGGLRASLPSSPGRHASESEEHSHSSVWLLAASQMSWHRMLDADYFICETPKVIKVFTEEENTSMSPWSSHNCLHTMRSLRQMLEHAVVMTGSKSLPMKLKK